MGAASRAVIASFILMCIAGLIYFRLTTGFEDFDAWKFDCLIIVCLFGLGACLPGLLGHSFRRVIAALIFLTLILYLVDTLNDPLPKPQEKSEPSYLLGVLAFLSFGGTSAFYAVTGHFPGSYYSVFDRDDDDVDDSDDDDEINAEDITHRIS